METPTGQDISLKGRHALITGGGSGLGFIMADALAQAGADVTICGRRLDVLDQSRATLLKHGGKVTAVTADVSKPEEIAQLKADVGPVDILINNAGYSIRKPSWLDVKPAEWEEVLKINLQAPFMMAQAFVPGMMERKWGRVINLSSVYGVVASNPDHYPDMASDNTSYVASKHALIGLSKNLAMRVAGHGVTVNTLSPGIFPGVSKQERSDGVRAGALTAQQLNQAIPMHRFGEDPDLRSLIVFMAGPGSAYITGQTFVVDGGFTIS